MAVNTWEGSTEPTEQAEPVETLIPSKSQLIAKACPSTPKKEMLIVLGNPSSEEWKTISSSDEESDEINCVFKEFWIDSKKCSSALLSCLSRKSEM